MNRRDAMKVGAAIAIGAPLCVPKLTIMATLPSGADSRVFSRLMYAFYPHSTHALYKDGVLYKCVGMESPFRHGAHYIRDGAGRMRVERTCRAYFRFEADQKAPPDLIARLGRGRYYRLQPGLTPLLSEAA